MLSAPSIMAIPTTHQQERLSLAYVQAVVANAGAQLLEPTGHEYGIDAYIQGVRRLPNGKFHPTGFMVMAQIKSTITSTIREDVIVYDMEAEAYNKIATMEGPTDCVLILCCLPRDSAEWLVANEDQLILKRCCYWMRIPKAPTTKSDSKRVFIPRTQTLTAEAVRRLLSEAGMINP